MTSRFGKAMYVEDLPVKVDGNALKSGESLVKNFMALLAGNRMAG